MSPVTLVTGAASGIGRAIAAHLRARGHLVAGVDLAWATHDGFEARLDADVSDEDAMRRAVHDVERALGPIDALVHSAAITDLAHHTVRELPLAVWERVLRVNATGSLVTARAVLDGMVGRGRGNLVFVTSSLALWKGGIAGDAPYSASKAAVEMLAHVLALETRSAGLNVNTLYPSVKVDTGFFAHLSAPERASLAPPTLLDACAAFLTELPPGSLTGASVDQQAWDDDPGYAPRLRHMAGGTP